MSKKDIIICLIIFFVGIFSRAPLIEHVQSHWDGPQFSIAIARKFDFSQETPAVPGYPLYVALASFLYLFIHDPHLAFLIISVLFSGIGALAFFLFGKLIYTRTVGLISASIFLSASVFYFFGLTVYGYIITPTMTLLLAFVVYFAFVKKRPLGLALGTSFALELGFRPQELFFVLPLFVLGICSLSNRERLKAFMSFTFILLVWFIPYIEVSGGINNLIHQSLLSTASGSIPKPSLSHAFQTFTILAQGAYLSLGIGPVFLLYFLKPMFIFFSKRKKLITLLKNKTLIIYIVWAIPSIFFNVFIRSEHAGYQLTYLCAFTIVISYAVWRIFKKNNLVLTFIVLALVIFNLYIFFQNRDPRYLHSFRQTSFHYTDLRRNDLELMDKINFIKANFKPVDTIIIMDQVFWRQAMYYLPSFRIFVIDALMNNDSKVSNIRIDALNWKRKAYIYYGRNFNLPPNIKNIILFDNESPSWYQGQNKSVHNFAGIINITVINAEKAKSLLYNYHKLILDY